MKVTINRKSFIDALGIGGSMSGKAKTLPILDMAKVTIKDKKAIISSFDGEVAITLRSDIVDSEGDMVFCINTKDLLSILKSLKDEVLELDIANNVCVVLHSKGKMEVLVSDSEDFPTPNKDSESVGVSIESGVLASWVKKSKNFIEQSDIRPIMGGMYLYYGGNEVGCAATNAHKLYWDYKGVECGVEGTYDAVLTSKAMDALLGMLSGSDSVTIVFSDNNIAFKTSNAMLMCRKIEGKFPAFRTIIPNGGNISVEVDMEDLRDAINRAVLMSGMTHLLKITFSGFNMHIESCDFDFGKKSNEDVVCNVSGGEITLGVNGEFLLNCLNALEGNKVVMTMQDSARPIVFREENTTVLQMPMRLA